MKKLIGTMVLSGVLAGSLAQAAPAPPPHKAAHHAKKAKKAKKQGKAHKAAKPHSAAKK
jgi:Ni/Co efflux regulator RcnB